MLTENNHNTQTTNSNHLTEEEVMQRLQDMKCYDDEPLPTLCTLDDLRIISNCLYEIELRSVLDYFTDKNSDAAYILGHTRLIRSKLNHFYMNIGYKVSETVQKMEEVEE